MKEGGRTGLEMSALSGTILDIAVSLTPDTSEGRYLLQYGALMHTLEVPPQKRLASTLN